MGIRNRRRALPTAPLDPCLLASTPLQCRLALLLLLQVEAGVGRRKPAASQLRALAPSTAEAAREFAVLPSSRSGLY